MVKQIRCYRILLRILVARYWRHLATKPLPDRQVNYAIYVSEHKIQKLHLRLFSDSSSQHMFVQHIWLDGCTDRQADRHTCEQIGYSLFLSGLLISLQAPIRSTEY